MLGAYNNWNIITLSHKYYSIDNVEHFYQAVLDGISDNMKSLVQTRKYGTISITVDTTEGYYIIKLYLESYTLK